jgi:hypothetical protein
MRAQGHKISDSYNLHKTKTLQVLVRSSQQLVYSSYFEGFDVFKDGKGTRQGRDRKEKLYGDWRLWVVENGRRP